MGNTHAKVNFVGKKGAMCRLDECDSKLEEEVHYINKQYGGFYTNTQGSNQDPWCKG